MIEDERFPRCSVYCDYSFGHTGDHSQGQLLTKEYVKQAAEEVFREMGSGHSESVYEACMALELSTVRHPVNRQVAVALSYKGYTVGAGFIDILFNGVVVELKTVAKLTPKDVQQVRKYLVALDLENGLLINFGNDLEIIEIQKEGNHDETSSSEG